MKYEDSAYGKFGIAMTKKQIRHWNLLRLEIYGLADYILDRCPIDGRCDEEKRLKELVGQLPVFDDDGEGFYRAGKGDLF